LEPWLCAVRDRSANIALSGEKPPCFGAPNHDQEPGAPAGKSQVLVATAAISFELAEQETREPPFNRQYPEGERASRDDLMKTRDTRDESREMATDRMATSTTLLN